MCNTDEYMAEMSKQNDELRELNRTVKALHAEIRAMRLGSRKSASKAKYREAANGAATAKRVVR